ncbi:hypothetical protein GCM10010423_70080 [Streptomyces levis]|uniref:Uncharacterized protein n=1 Tax=Streptomyces levis TaxID=285566 RepID=A0ABN3P2E8_9ACTN
MSSTDAADVSRTAPWCGTGRWGTCLQRRGKGGAGSAFEIRPHRRFYAAKAVLDLEAPAEMTGKVAELAASFSGLFKAEL